MLFRNPRLFAFLLMAIGVGLIGYFGEQRWRLPEWTEADIEESVQLKLALELHQRGPHLQPTRERLEELHATVRAETEASIRRERRDVERWIGLGALMCMLGAGRWLVDVIASRRVSN
jgi:hypothetical protein